VSGITVIVCAELSHKKRRQTVASDGVVARRIRHEHGVPGQVRHNKEAPMRRLLLTLMMIGNWSSVAVADAVYRDPRHPSFQVLVPDGWTVQRQQAGITLSNGSDSFALWVIGGAKSPGSMLVQIRPQLEQQWKEFREAATGRLTFGGQPASYAVYTGIPPSGVRSIQRVVAMSNGRLTFVAFARAPADRYQAAKPVLDRIELSFQPDSVM
jgi:hypothetical protein